mgnify:CR=1 FL=1
MKLIINIIIIFLISITLNAREIGETEITTEDGIEVFQNEKYYLLKQNVKIVSDNFTLRADKVKINFDKSLYDITELDANGNVAERNSNQIFHHKWMWVGDDYKGFDVGKEYNWSKQWTSKVDNFSGIGKKENWDRILEEKGLEVEGYREALSSGGAATIDFPFERKRFLQKYHRL